MARDLKADHATLRAVYEAAQAGNHAEAGSLAEAALAQGLEHPLLLNVAALDLDAGDSRTRRCRCSSGR